MTPQEEQSEGLADAADDYWTLNRICRGSSDGPTSDEACAQREAITHGIAVGTMNRLVHAWRQEDWDTVAALSAPAADIVGQLQDVIPDSDLHQCHYDFSAGSRTCQVLVAEGWGVLIQLEHADDLLWHVVAIGSFDVD